MQERIQRVIDMLELVEVRRSQNHKLLATAIDSLRAIQAEAEKEDNANEHMQGPDL